MTTYANIEQMISEERYSDILDGLKDTFVVLEGLSQNLIMGVYENPDEAYKMMLQSAGFWEQLKVIHTTVDTYKSNKEKRYYQQKKMEIESTSNTKFNSSATEGEASALTVDLRRVRNIIGAYMEMADKNVMVCQSLLKYFNDSNKRSILQEG